MCINISPISKQNSHLKHDLKFWWVSLCLLIALSLPDAPGLLAASSLLIALGLLDEALIELGTPTLVVILTWIIWPQNYIFCFEMLLTRPNFEHSFCSWLLKILFSRDFIRLSAPRNHRCLACYRMTWHTEGNVYHEWGKGSGLFRWYASKKRTLSLLSAGSPPILGLIFPLRTSALYCWK